MTGKVQDGDGITIKRKEVDVMPTPAEEKRWQAEEDARIIAQYLELMKDEARVLEASKIAELQVEELTKRLANMKEVAKKGKK